MANQKASELIKKMSTDSAFRKEVESASTKEARLAILAQHGFSGISAEDVRSVAKAEGTELSEAELEAVAGGRAVEWAGVIVAAAALLV
jgi:predicted ribosomally synthesized peptide with nif11-like leader